MFNHAKFNHIKFNSKIEVPIVPATFESTYDIGITRKAVWLERIVRRQ